MPLNILLAVCVMGPSVRQQDMSIPITYSTRAARAATVVAEIGKLAKLDLQTSPQTEREILVVSVDKQPLSEVMARIATVTSGEWKAEAGGYRLIANQAMQRQEEKNDLLKGAAEIRKAIDERLKQERKQQEQVQKALKQAEEAAKKQKKGGQKDGAKDQIPVDPNQAVDMPFSAGVSAEESAITHLLAGLDPTVLASLTSGDRMVFSSDPNRMQRSFGSDAPEIINTFIQRHNEEISHMPADGGFQEDQTGMDEATQKYFKQMMKQRTSKIGAVAKAVLVAKHSGMLGAGGFTEIELRLYDNKGMTVYSGQSTLMLGSNRFMPAVADVATPPNGPDTAVPPTKPQEPKTHTEIQFSDDSKALMSSLQGMTTGSFKLNFTADLKRKISLPNMYDPLSFMQTDEVLAYAKQQGKPLVANLPDDWESNGMMNFMGMDKASSVEEVAEGIKKGETLSQVADAAFTVLKPATPSKSRLNRLDRLALTSLMRAVEERGVPSLNDLAQFALRSPDPSDGGVLTFYMAMFVPGGMLESFMGNSSWDMYRFFGGLSPDAKATLNNGGSISIGTLNAIQKAALMRMTYGASSNLSVDDPNSKPDETPFWMRFRPGQGSLDYRSEPTELLPTGLPADGTVTLRATNESFASPQATGGQPLVGMLGILGPDEMAMFQMMKNTKGAEAAAGFLPNLGQVKVGYTTVMNFTFHLTNDVSIRQTLKDHGFPPNSQIVSENNLPEAFQKQINDRMAVLKKSGMGNFAGMMGGGNIHP